MTLFEDPVLLAVILLYGHYSPWGAFTVAYSVKNGHLR